MNREKIVEAERLLGNEVLTKWQNGRDTGYMPDASRVEQAWRLLREALGMREITLLHT